MHWAKKQRFQNMRSLRLLPVPRETWPNTLKISEAFLYLGGKWIDLESNNGLENPFPELLVELSFFRPIIFWRGDGCGCVCCEQERSLSKFLVFLPTSCSWVSQVLQSDLSTTNKPSRQWIPVQFLRTYVWYYRRSHHHTRLPLRHTRWKGKDIIVEEKPQIKYAPNYLDLWREAAVHLSSEENY